MSAIRTASSEIASLNGIRALAVGLVFFSHGGVDSLVPGGLGVTVFFVLSGFLITTLMRREYSVTHSLALSAFYLRRVIRLMPPLFVVVALAALLSALSLVEGAFSLRGLLSVLFYFGNYYVIAQDFDGIPAGLGVVWSLAVEEHYYLLYPPLALLLLRHQSARVAVLSLAAVCMAILAWRCILVWTGTSEAYISMATDTRADAILIGCAMAFLRNPVLDPVPPAHCARDALILAACFSALLLTLIYRDETFRSTARYTVQSLAIAPLIYMAVARADQPVFRWLNTRPMIYLGTVSYTIYLSHQMFLYLVIRNSPQLDTAATLGLTAVLTLTLAEVMRRLVEQPSARLRRSLHAPALAQGASPGAQTAAAR